MSPLDQAAGAPTPPARRITIISASVGAGHDGAAKELGRRLEAAGYATDHHDFVDLLPGRFGRILSGAYHRLLVLAPAGYQQIYASLGNNGRPGLALRLLLRSAERRTLSTVGRTTHAVVATYPGASQVLGALRHRGALDVPVLTYLTDFSVHPLWVAPGVDVHLATHAVPAAQARALGARRVHVTGPVTGPRFRPTDETDRRAARERLGLPRDTVLALLVAGSWGVGDVARTAQEIRDGGAAVPVVVCGHNQALEQRLRREGFAHVRGWEKDMPALMQACDVLVQNAGGLSSLEAFASGLPVLSYRCIPGHGLTNAAALDEAGLAPWVHTPEDLLAAVAALAGGRQRERQRAAGLSLCARESGPDAMIAAVAENHTAEPQPRAISVAAGSVGPRRRIRVAVLASGLALTMGLGIGAPVVHAFPHIPGHVSGAAHRFIEDHEL